MKNLLIILSVSACLFACSKSVDLQQENTNNSPKDRQSCNFGLTQFNLVQRATVADEFSNRKPIQSSNGGGGTLQTGASSVILLDFDGQLVSGTSWNSNGSINCMPANLSTTNVQEIVDRVGNDFSPFNVIVTTDESVYNAASANKRTRVIITETYEWYGQAGGVSFVGSFTWGDNTPCFVFSLLLKYNIKFIAEAVSHEAGHTLGLYHQATYDATGIKTSDYNYGQGSGETGWAPIMGVGYYQNTTLWHNGANSYGCTSFQNDVAIITNVIGGTKADDYSNTTTNATQLTGLLNGLITNSSDVDFFYVDNSTTKTISLAPFSTGVNNTGANLDLVLKIYSSTGSLISVVDSPGALNIVTTLNPGKYYLSVTTTANQFAGTYGMLGLYNISLF